MQDGRQTGKMVEWSAVLVPPVLRQAHAELSHQCTRKIDTACSQEPMKHERVE